MVDALAKVRNKLKGDFAMLFLIVTADMKISDDLLKYAADKGIMVKVGILMYDKDTKEFNVSNPKFVNAGYIYENGENKTVAEVAKNATVDRYKPVKAKDATPIKSTTTDPDPAEYDDY